MTASITVGTTRSRGRGGQRTLGG